MAGHSTYQPKNRLRELARERAADHRPGPRLLRRLSDAAQPELLVDLRRRSWPSCWWRRSSPASCSPCTTSPHATLAFDSVEHIMRDVNYGWLLRYLHANGASLFFLAVYIHIFRGLYYGSYKEPREVLWILGVIIFLLMMATAFMGYVLPWGQMSFWGATVITSLFSAIPLVGESITTWLWGGFAVDNPTLNRFFSLHYLLPFMIAGVVVLHIWALHVAGQNNPTGIEVKSKQDTVPFTPLLRRSRTCSALVVLPGPVRLVRLLPAELSRPSGQLHPGQPAEDAGAYRAGMVLPAVLRDPPRHPEQAPRRARAVRRRSRCCSSCPGSTRRGCARRSSGRSTGSSSGSSSLVCIGLGYLGSQPPEGGYVIAARILTAYYFVYFLIILPLLGLIETPKPLPASITEAVLAKARRAPARRRGEGLSAMKTGMSACAGSSPGRCSRRCARRCRLRRRRPAHGACASRRISRSRSRSC